MAQRPARTRVNTLDGIRRIGARCVSFKPVGSEMKIEVYFLLFFHQPASSNAIGILIIFGREREIELSI